MNYSEKLRDPRWQKKRLEILNRDEWSCCWCGVDDKTLHVHHLEYSGNPWDTPDKFLLTVCEDCHESEHINRKNAEEQLLAKLKALGFSWSALLDITTGFYHLNMDPLHPTTSSVINFILKDKELLEIGRIKYEAYVKALRKEKESDEGIIDAPW